MRATLLAALLAAGCYNPNVADGTLLCSADNKCPRGLRCACDGACYHAGKGPLSCDDGGSGSGSDLGGSDLGGSDGFETPGNPGDPCASDAMCASSFCSVDGVCCDSKCDGACQACNLPGTAGTCTNVAAGNMPAPNHPMCGPDAKSTCMRDGLCDGRGACALWQNVVCKAGSCDPLTNKATGDSKCDGAGNCVTPNAIVCDPFLCDSQNLACQSTCTGTGSGQCKPPATCTGGSCGTKANGSTCTSGPQCTSGNCIDGVCCDTTCTGKCQACDLPATLGACSPVTSGQPHGTRGNCAGFGTSCSGVCASGNTASCSFPGNQLPNVTCVNQSCLNSTTQIDAAQCNGAGACNSPTQMSCGNYVCAGNACLTSCTTDANCSPSAPYCNGTSCLATKPVGRACGGNSECTSTFCADGYCCATDCMSQQCMRCDVSPGTCTNTANGTAPVDGRPVCGGTVVICDGTCNGSGACGNYPGNTIACTDATGGPGFCNGAGSCVGTGCFLGDTPVDTADGPRPIAEIAAGDLVRSFDVFAGDDGWRKVTQVQTRRTRSLVTLVLGDGSRIQATPEHYFWVLGSGWVRALELTPRDYLLNDQGVAASVASLTSRSARDDGAEVDVYNLVVEGTGTYFVGEAPVLVESCDYVNFSSLGDDDLPR